MAHTTHPSLAATPDRSPVRWRAAPLAGLLAGLVFLALELLLVPLSLGGSAWGPPRMIAALVLGRDVLPPPATFHLGIVLVALVVHFTLSALYGAVLGALVHRLGAGAAISVGALFGLALYLVNFYGFTALFPWFADARNWVSVLAHVVFGVIAAWAYDAQRLRVPIRVDRAPPAPRRG